MSENAVDYASIESRVQKAIDRGIYEGVKSVLNASYNNPLLAVINDSITDRASQLRELLETSIAATVDDPEFREQIRVEVRRSLAKQLVQRFGGELEKQVNLLKSDPTTRARITIAIEEIVKSKV